MGQFKIIWKESAQNDFNKIDRRYTLKIFSKIETLIQNPRPIGCKKLTSTEKTYRIRLSDYRIIYQVDDEEKEVLINHVQHRKDVYRAR